MVGIIEANICRSSKFSVCNKNVTIRTERVVDKTLTELSKRSQPHGTPQ